jgi:hypothetical protein
MKKQHRLIALFTMIAMVIIGFQPNLVQAQVKPPVSPPSLSAPGSDEFRKAAEADYKKIDNPEISFEKFLDIRRQQAAARLKAKAVAAPPIGGQCTNGNFETGLDPLQWSGQDGSYNTEPASSLPVGLSFNAGFTLSPGLINSATAHQTLVPPPGTDPYAPVSTTNPFTGGTKAVRIGNGVNGSGAEALTKTFKVTQATMGYWYAAVFEDPGHSPSSQPSFMVQVLDASGNDITSLTASGTPRTTPRANLSANSNMLIADSANPFFQTSPTTGPNVAKVVYKNWTCATIDLGDLVGQTVTVRFVTRDCGKGGHAGWAYVDDVCDDCAKSPDGSISFNAAASNNCGPGKLCFDYTVPKAGTTTGTTKITLNLMQNGAIVQTLQSPTLTSNGQYCFTLDAALLASLNNNLGAFDYGVTANPAINGVSLPPKLIGSTPNGINTTQNDDYRIGCNTTPQNTASTCCPPLDKQLLRSMFAHIGMANSTYNMRLIPSAATNFQNGYNAYLNYLKFVCPNVTKLRVTFQLNTTTGAGGPLTPIPGAVATATFNGGTPIYAPSSFFTQALNNNAWYGINAVTEGLDANNQPASCGFSGRCNSDDRFTFQFQIGNKSTSGNGLTIGE